MIREVRSRQQRPPRARASRQHRTCAERHGGKAATALLIVLFLRLLAAAGVETAVSQAVPDGSDALLSSLCEDWDAAGDEFVIAGPRVSLIRRATHDTQDITAARLRPVVGARPDLFVAVHGEWATVYAPASGRVLRRDCRAKTTQILPVHEPIARLAISAGGDIAMLTVTTQSIVVTGGSRAYSPTQTPIGRTRAPESNRKPGDPIPVEELLRIPGADTTDLVWQGGRLVAVGRTGLSTFRFDGTSYSSVKRPLVRSADASSPSPSAVLGAFVFNGVLYVRRDQCWDLYVGDTLTPAVPGTSCDGVATADTSFVIVDKEHVHFRGPASGALRTTSRPTLIAATLSGTTREISSALTSVLRLVTSVKPVSHPESARRSYVGQWALWLPRQAWVARDYDEASQTLERVGWAPLVQDESWWVARGMAVTWQETVEFVTANGRSLDEFAAGIRLGRFTDEQLDFIRENNRNLDGTLEGQLIANRWLPIGALLGGSTELPLAFEGLATVQALAASTAENRAAAARRAADAVRTASAAGTPLPPLSDALQSELRDLVRACASTHVPTGDDAQIERTLVNLATRGAELAGGLERTVAQAVTTSAVAAVQFRADRVWSVACGAAAGAPSSETAATHAPMRLLLAESAIVGPRVDRKEVAREAPEPGGVTQTGYRPSGEGIAPVRVRDVVVLGVQRAEWRTARAAPFNEGVRSWLNRVVRARPLLGPILMPSVAMRLLFVADAAQRERLAAIEHVSVLSAEGAPAKARLAGPCDQTTTPAAIRELAEKEIKLNTINAAQRALSRTNLAIAENDVALTSRVFARADGTSIWREPNDQGLPRPINPSQLRPIQRLEDMKHGTAIGALLAATAAPGGLVNTQPIWLDLRKSPDDLNRPLSVLAARGAIINVSGQLGAPWATVEADAVTSTWRDNLLLVAAVRNPDEQEHGFPLAWRGETSMMGIGTLDAAGNVPIYYSLDYVDLLAPGQTIASLDENGAAVCDSGTSFATAYASAIAALLAERDPNLRMWQIRARLLATATWDAAYKGRVKGGMIDAQRALDHLGDDVLTVRVGSGTGGGSLEHWTVILDDSGAPTLSFKGRRAVTTGRALGLKPKTVDWTRILRMQRTGGDVNGPTYRITFIDEDDEFTVYEDAQLLKRTAPIPIGTNASGRDQCVNLRDPNEEVSCRGTTNEQVEDFVRGTAFRATIVGFK